MRRRCYFTMVFQYSIEDLAKLCKVSKQSIYNLIKKNRDFIEKNSIRKGKKVKYNQEVLNLFLDYYGLKETEVSPPDETTPKITPEQPSTTPTIEYNAEDKIKALESEIEALKTELARLREENNQLIKQNGQVLLLLQEEKTEKLKLLPAPKKTIRERIGNFLRNEKR